MEKKRLKSKWSRRIKGDGKNGRHNEMKVGNRIRRQCEHCGIKLVILRITNHREIVVGCPKCNQVSRFIDTQSIKVH